MSEQIKTEWTYLTLDEFLKKLQEIRDKEGNLTVVMFKQYGEVTTTIFVTVGEVHDNAIGVHLEKAVRLG